MGLSNPGEVAFVEGVSSQTGIDPRVVIAWEKQENAYASGGTGGFNYLNLRPYPGDPYSSVSQGNFEQFKSVNDAVVATVRRLRQPFAAPILAAARAHSTPAAEIAAIAQTGWDSGHYGGPGGPNLQATFASLFTSGGLSSPYEPPSSAPLIVGSVGTGSAADAGSFDITGSGGGPSVVGAAKGAADAAKDAAGKFTGWVGELARFLGSIALRVGKVLLGAALLLLGLYLIAKGALPAAG